MYVGILATVFSSILCAKVEGKDGQRGLSAPFRMFSRLYSTWARLMLIHYRRGYVNPCMQFSAILRPRLSHKRQRRPTRLQLLLPSRNSRPEYRLN